MARHNINVWLHILWGYINAPPLKIKCAPERIHICQAECIAVPEILALEVSDLDQVGTTSRANA